MHASSSRRPEVRATTKGRVRLVAAMVAALAVVATTLGVGASPASAATDYPTVDGEYQGTGSLGPGSVLELLVVGRGGVPATGADAVVLNVTVANSTGSSYLTVFPSGEARPTASNLNFVAGQTTANMVVSKIGAGGKISIFNLTGSTNVIVDVMGWFPTGGNYTALTPARLSDSRPGYPTVDGLFSGTGLVPGASALNVTVVGRGGVPATGVDAVVLNVTVVDSTLPSYVTVYPAGEPRPTASNVNFVAGQTAANLVVAKVGAGGQVSLFNFSGATNIVVDVMGWFSSTGDFSSLTPARLADSRPAYPTIDTLFSGTGQLGANGVFDLKVVDRGGVPATGVDAVVLNVTVADPTLPSYLTVYPTGEPRPTASNINFVAGQTTANMAIAKVSAAGTVSIFNFSGSTNVIVDVMGWFPTGGDYTGLTIARLADSRGLPTSNPDQTPTPPSPLPTNPGGQPPATPTGPTGPSQAYRSIDRGGFFYADGTIAPTWETSGPCEIVGEKVHLWFDFTYLDGTQGTEFFWFDITSPYVESLIIFTETLPLTPYVFLDTATGQCVTYLPA